MKKMLTIAAMMMVAVCASAQNVVSVNDASNMTAKELKKAAKEAKVRDKIVATSEKAKMEVVKGEKKVAAAQKTYDKAAQKATAAAKKAEDAQRTADKAKAKLEDAQRDLTKLQGKADEAAKAAAKATGLPLADEEK